MPGIVSEYRLHNTRIRGQVEYIYVGYDTADRHVHTATKYHSMSKTWAFQCYVTVGTFARRGLSSTAKTLRSLSCVRGSEY